MSRSKTKTANGHPSVAALRKELGLTQQEFATALGLSTVSVSRWEHRHTEPTDSSRALVRLLFRAYEKAGAKRLVAVLNDLTGAEEDERLIALVHLGDSGRR